MNCGEIFQEPWQEISSILSTYKREVHMALSVTKPIREFLFSGVRLPDPNASMTVDDVRAFYTTTYPELATAVVNGPEAIGNKLRYTLDRSIGSKG